MQTIRLEQAEWAFDEGAGLGPPGGFGEVFQGQGANGPVAIKRLKLSAGAASHREMNIGATLANRTHEYVVPVLDYGQDADSDRYFLVMPMCDRSLQDLLNQNGPLALADAKTAALNIASGLREVIDIVHRDLKPGNVLWHEGRWKIADFGIAKFVEDATSLQSLRSSLTPAYAAPEQWRGERPSNATDVYALGCIMHALLSGAPPFIGSLDDIREAHLHTPAPSLPNVEPRLAGLVSTMLRKSPTSRPSLERCISVIGSVDAGQPSAARSALAAAGRAVSEEQARADAQRSASEAAARSRRELAAEARMELRGIIDRLFDAIEAETDSAERAKNAITLGPAHLMFRDSGDFLETAVDPFQAGWDIVCSASLELRADRRVQRVSYSDPGLYVFSASLVFAKTNAADEYRWRELSFHEMFSQRPNYDQPFSLAPASREFQVAISRTMGNHQVAHGPLMIDGEDEDQFQDRWLKLFAKAAARQLVAPDQLPLPPSFFG